MCWPLGKQGNYPRALKLLNQALEIANDPSSEKSIGNLPKGQNSNTFRLLILSNIHLGFGFLYGNTGNYERRKFVI